MEFNAKNAAQGACIAALYAALTVLLAPISYGALQCRVAEALCVLPLFTPSAIWGLTVGCVIANIIGGNGLVDIVFGSLATLLGALFTYRMRKKRPLALLFPVLFNSLIVGSYLHFLVTPAIALPLVMLYVALGEAVALYALGYPLSLAIDKSKMFKEQ